MHLCSFIPSFSLFSLKEERRGKQRRDLNLQRGGTKAKWMQMCVILFCLSAVKLLLWCSYYWIFRKVLSSRSSENPERGLTRDLRTPLLESSAQPPARDDLSSVKIRGAGWLTLLGDTVRTLLLFLIFPSSPTVQSGLIHTSTPAEHENTIQSGIWGRFLLWNKWRNNGGDNVVEISM